MWNEPNESEVSATIHKTDGDRFKAIQTVGWAMLSSLCLVEAKAPLFISGLASYLQIREVIILHENCGESRGKSLLTRRHFEHVDQGSVLVQNDRRSDKAA